MANTQNLHTSFLIVHLVNDRRKSSVSSEFQLSMLKTSLSFDPGIAGKEENNERGIPRRRKKSLGNYHLLKK